MAHRPVTIRIVVSEGKEILLSTIVPPKTGIHYEFPEPLDLEDGNVLMAVDVIPRVELSEEKKKFREEVRGAPLKSVSEKNLGKLFDIDMDAPKPTIKTGEHAHVVENRTMKAFHTCVRPTDCDPRAHGGMATYEECKCGMTKVTNHNRQYTEEGTWTRWSVAPTKFPNVK